MPRGRRERGTVTAEAAMVLPVVTAFCLALTWMITIGIAQIRVVDAARDAARAAARGDGRQAAVAAARGAAPAGSRVDIASANRTTTVKVSDSVVPPGWLIVPLPSVTVTAHASVRDEDDVPES